VSSYAIFRQDARVKTAALALLAIALVGCSDDGAPALTFGSYGPLSTDAGRGSFRFGASTAATQIEDMNPATDWWLWTAPAPAGLGRSPFVGDAVRGYSKVMDDVALIQQLGVDSYRFSIEWARIEPIRNQIDQTAVAHYRDELLALRAMGIHPVITLHHFSNPVWVHDPRDVDCADGPRDANLCGLGSAGGASVIAEMAQHAGFLAETLGDLVDDWGTLNEPVNYLLAAYAIGSFPPGKVTIAQIGTAFVAVVRDFIAAHAAMYRAIKARDTVDADGDGIAAEVGLSLSVAAWQPARDNQLSTDPTDIAARDRLVALFHYLFADALVRGMLDTNLDGQPDEQHPELAGTLDWLGLQYYFRSGVTGATQLIPTTGLAPCFGGFDLGACLPPLDPTYCVPRMGYEGWPGGIHDILVAFHDRYPGLPLVVTEAGISTDVGRRRAENIVRTLEAIARARDEGVDVRGYYHWSLTDNFEWSEGFGPHFGLYSVDYTTYARTATEGADVLAAIAKSRSLTSAQRARYGGTGPMTPEAGFDQFPTCRKIPAP
jgi:beta-glucosidase/6-phospho-beta-glucosidase/beta-galactosidase